MTCVVTPNGRSDKCEPTLSVVMPVYNGERYLRDAVNSILAQTFADIEFIIVDDGSTDGTLSILAEYDDPRIKLIRNDYNRGISWSLNRGISTAAGEYIARMDCDDISYPKRLMIQVDFLEANVDIDVVGSWIEIIDQDGVATGEVVRYPRSALGLRWVSFFHCSFAHPSVVARRAFFERTGKYNEELGSLVDHELWTRSNLNSRYANIQEVLLRYRVHESTLSAARKALQDELGCVISHREASRYLGKDIPLESFRLLQTPHRTQSPAILHSSIAALYELYSKFRRDHSLDQEETAEVNLDVAHRLSQISRQNRQFPSSWLLRLIAIILVVFTLFRSGRNRKPTSLAVRTA